MTTKYAGPFRETYLRHKTYILNVIGTRAQVFTVSSIGRSGQSLCPYRDILLFCCEETGRFVVSVLTIFESRFSKGKLRDPYLIICDLRSGVPSGGGKH